jgi:hypothetical protein
MESSTDRIEKKVILRAPLDRVWRAISSAREFGHWFGVTFDSDFSAGARVTGRITPTKADAEVAKAQEPYAGKPGFDRIPLARRAEAFAMNEGGWSAQAKLVEKYLAHAA